MIFILFVSACFLAFSNGANDNFKGVATLFGSDTISYKGAITWASVTTLAGSIAAIFLASSLVKNFSGKGLVPDEIIQDPEFMTSIALGAALTVFLATKIGMPISTTHALVGSLFGTGLISVGLEFNFTKLINIFLFPLLVSPLLSALLSLISYFILRKARLKLGVTKETCLCIGEAYTTEIIANSNKTEISSSLNSSIQLNQNQLCKEIYTGQFVGINAQTLLDFAHYTSAGIVSFSRGLNDTPKIVGMLIIISTLNIQIGIGVIAVAILLGGLLNAKKVGEMISKKITPLNHGQGFTANLITGLLVTTASIHGVPVSTTHVSVGSLFGIGIVTKEANLKVIQNILLSWVLTLPIAAIFSSLIFYVLKL